VLLRAKACRCLQTRPFGGDYAPGWMVAKRARARSPAFTHAGDNTMNFANVWMAPGRDLAILVCVNRSNGANRDGVALQATDKAVRDLIDLVDKQSAVENAGFSHV
jgi:hypothetical protein